MELDMQQGTPTRMPMTGPGYDFPVRINRLAIGTRFMSYISVPNWGLPDEMQFGTLLWIGPGSCEVWWDTDKATHRIQPELEVWVLDEQPLGWQLEEQMFWANTNYRELSAREHAALVRKAMQTDGEVDSKLEEEITVAEAQAVNPAAKALVARYSYQLKGLLEALEGDDKAKAAISMTRISKCIFEAKQTGVELPKPQGALAEYAPLAEEFDKAQEAIKTKAASAAASASAQADRVVAREVAKEKHKTVVATAKEAKEPREPKAKAEKKLRPCLDGCGAMVPGNFQMGHDAKLKSMLIKVERGDLPLDVIPEICQDLVKIVKGDAIQDRDSAGNAKGEPKQTYRIVAAPVRFPGRDDVELTKRDD